MQQKQLCSIFLLVRDYAATFLSLLEITVLLNWLTARQWFQLDLRPLRNTNRKSYTASQVQSSLCYSSEPKCPISTLAPTNFSTHVNIAETVQSGYHRHLCVYRLRSRGDNTLGSVCVCVRPFVCGCSPV